MKRTKLGELKIPDGYFKGRSNIRTPEKVLYNFLDTELTDKGALVYIKNAKYPHKTIPVSDAVAEINTLKVYIKHTLPTLVFGINSYVKNFNHFFNKTVFHQLNIKSVCPTSKGLFHIIYDISQYLKLDPTLWVVFAYNIIHVFEFDDAYRYRVQDIFTMINMVAFYKNQRKELRRVFDIALSREVHDPQREKMRKLYRMIVLSTYYPPFKHALRCILPLYIHTLKFDEGDAYWAGFKDNYHFRGINHEEHKKSNPIPEMFTFE